MIEVECTHEFRIRVLLARDGRFEIKSVGAT